MSTRNQPSSLRGHKCNGAVLAVHVNCECGWSSANWSGTGARRSAYSEWRQHVAEHRTPKETGLTLGGLPPRILKASLEIRSGRPSRSAIEYAGRDKGAALTLVRHLLSVEPETLTSRGLFSIDDVAALREFEKKLIWPLKEAADELPRY